MLVRSRMTSHVHTASPDTTLAEALGMTRAHRIRHLPILDDDRLVGLVSDRDLRLAMPPIWADEHMAEVILGAEPSAIAELANRRLAPLEVLRPAQRERLPSGCCGAYISPLELDVQAWHAGAAAIFVLVGVFYPAIVTLLTYESNRQLGPTLTGAVSCTAPLFAVLTGTAPPGSYPSCREHPPVDPRRTPLRVGHPRGLRRPGPARPVTRRSAPVAILNAAETRRSHRLVSVGA